MTAHQERAIAQLKKHLLTLSARVEEAVRAAVKSLEDRDARLAQQVIEGDTEIDKREVEIEEECLKILALFQPVASDLRFIVTVLKINDGLERIADVAVNIAERSLFLAPRKQPEIFFNFPVMAQKAQAMLKHSLDALVEWDTDLARRVCADDDEVDTMNREMYEQTKAELRKGAEDVDTLIHLLSVSGHLERVADLATNIAEDVVYLVEGEIVRHRTEDFES